jgi:lipopolysaccharide assembly outer membrane protein LptD (OstA)
MLKFTGLLLLCAASTISAAQTLPEIFVIQAGHSGREATIKIPVGAVATFSANAAEALNGYADPKVEAMRLSGNVLINVIGASQPIQIKADKVVLELTADETPAAGTTALMRSTEIIVGADDSQTFVGNVFFSVQTSSGVMQIRADQVEHMVAPAGAAPTGV